MLLARIVGTVVATRKDPRLVSNKLLVVRPVDPKGKPEGSYLVAVDTVDAGVGETVLIVSGSSARRMPRATVAAAGGLAFLECMQQIPIHRLMTLNLASIFICTQNVKGLP